MCEEKEREMRRNTQDKPNEKKGKEVRKIRERVKEKGKGREEHERKEGCIGREYEIRD